MNNTSEGFGGIPHEVLTYLIEMHVTAPRDIITLASTSRKFRRAMRESVINARVIMSEGAYPALELETGSFRMRYSINGTPHGTVWPEAYLDHPLRYVIHSDMGHMPPCLIPSCHTTLVISPPVICDQSIRIFPFVSTLIIIFSNPKRHLDVTIESLRMREICIIGNMVSLRCREGTLCSVDLLRVSKHPGMVKVSGFMIQGAYIPRERKKFDISWVGNRLVYGERKYECNRSRVKNMGGVLYIDDMPRSFVH